MSKVKNIVTIALETYKQKVVSKVFVIILLVLMVGTFLGMNYEGILKKEEPSKETILVVSNNQETVTMLKEVGKGTNLNFVDGGQKLSDAEKELKDRASKTILKIEKSSAGLYEGALQYNVSEQLQSLVTTVNQSIKLNQLNIDAAQQQFLNESTRLSLESLAGNQDNSVQTLILVYIVGFILYIAVMLFSTMVAQDIAVEKSSRVMEILLTTITPVQHLIGKIVGIGLVGVTQAAAIFGAAYASYGIFGDSTGVFDFLSEGKNSQAIILAIICFVLGYLLYSVTAAILGSVVSSVQEVQQLMYILIIPLFIAMFMVMILAAGLGSNQATIISSYIPYLSPIVMYARYMLGDASLNAFAVAMGINLVFTAILAFLGKSVYQGGVFIYSGDKLINVFKKAFKSGKYYVR
ncbi:ABC transporter permease [Enterococcus faecalis]|uniref:ABC transporter permease n=1 Tax=Enterococcus faecalis TaxID=1351 RepID=UPI000667D084|nr:ABC transporter permease [Enterococcus faecalis]MDU3437189.1 ABC transporter permease [Enterococcus faecalis]MDU3444589.1 ABC transporter permease [Enterococcus faecalis]MDU3485024.1 ABC transporter permease [Enterococcus faecalis]MDU3710207.1 ABC transporter permease [Enterococcus faecalis]MDV2578525.1 ABC transporter permease [Enterococcus faecalis]